MLILSYDLDLQRVILETNETKPRPSDALPPVRNSGFSNPMIRRSFGTPPTRQLPSSKAVS